GAVICYRGLFIVNPNQPKVVQLFGSYMGTVKRAGFHWVNPLTARKPVSTRVRNFESARLKVNDHVGNPIEIAAVVVWRVVDTAEAVFEVDDFKNFVQVQSEAAVRNLATSYVYDAHVEGEVSLRSHPAEISERLKVESRSGWPRPGSRSWKRASAIWRTPRRSRARCCGASRRAPSWPRASASSRARSAWSRWRRKSCPGRTSSTSTTSARRRW